MRENVLVILHSLQNKNQTITALANETRKLLDDLLDASSFVARLEDEIKLSTDQYHNNLPFYCFFLALGYFKQGDCERAKNILKESVQGFRLQNYLWNEALAEWLFAVIHLENGNNIRAERACETALDKMISLSREYREESDYESAVECDDRIKKIKGLMEYIKSLPPVEQTASATRPSPARAAQQHEDYMVLPWLPIYDSVQAGPNGPLWPDPSPKAGMAVQIIEIGGRAFQIFSIRTQAGSSDHRISLNHDLKYGWAKVSGQSMNAASPIPIDDGDYVLFCESWHDDRDGIVIACQRVTDSDYTHMVKKYDAKNRRLLSETRDTSRDYSPIPLSEEYYILGAVLAIAKPVK